MEKKVEGEIERIRFVGTRHTLGDKTLNARFGGGENATPVFDFALAGEVI